MTITITEVKKGAKKLADNMERYFGERKCKMCGREPEKEAKYIEKLLKIEYQRGCNDEREIVKR